ncbi:MAG TPA: TetR/AcrR family transcriptional regulator [Ktedonobacterales bacterium]|jgi:AcrR family transcriptional regulator
MAISSSRRRDDDAGTDQRESATYPPADGALDLSALHAALHPALGDLPREPRQARSREKRATLLRAAEALFTERGYAGVTADDIARAAGVSVGAFYNYFRNKKQILLALALLRLSVIFAPLRLAHMDLANSDHHAAIRATVAAVVAGERNTGLRAVWQQLMSLEPELAPYQATVRRYALGLIEERLRAAREKGDTWPGLDIEGVAIALFALLDGLSAPLDDDLPEERVIESVALVIERALFPPAALAPAGAKEGRDD